MLLLLVMMLISILVIGAVAIATSSFVGVAETQDQQMGQRPRHSNC